MCLSVPLLAVPKPNTASPEALLGFDNQGLVESTIGGNNGYGTKESVGSAGAGDSDGGLGAGLGHGLRAGFLIDVRADFIMAQSSSAAG